MRYHGVVGATLAGRPSVGIGYDPKVGALTADVGPAARFVPWTPNGLTSMAVAVEVTLSSYRWLATEYGGWAWTNRLIATFGHLRPSRDLVANSDAAARFNQGRSELGYSVGDTIMLTVVRSTETLQIPVTLASRGVAEAPVG